jgi:hypothetical protein
VHFADRGAVPSPVHEVDLINVFSSAIDLLFADPNLARDAAYAPADGDTLPVRIIARRPDSVTDFADARLWSETASFDVRVSEVALPRPRERLILDGEIFVIQGEPIRDAERLVWTLEARAQ